MKKNLFFILMLLCGIATMSAQGLRFGAEAAVDFSNPINSTGEHRTAFHIAAKGEYNFKNASKGWYLSAALGLYSKPGEDETGGEFDGVGNLSAAYTFSYTPWYLQLPVHVGYRYSLSNIVSLQIETGPYFAAGIFGREHLTIAYSNGNREKYSGSCFGKDGAFHRADIGWGVAAGVQLAGHWQVGVAYNLQFNSAVKESDIYNSVVGVTLGYIF